MVYTDEATGNRQVRMKGKKEQTTIPRQSRGPRSATCFWRLNKPRMSKLTALRSGRGQEYRRESIENSLGWAWGTCEGVTRPQGVYSSANAGGIFIDDIEREKNAGMPLLLFCNATSMSVEWSGEERKTADDHQVEEVIFRKGR